MHVIFTIPLAYFDVCFSIHFPPSSTLNFYFFLQFHQQIFFFFITFIDSTTFSSSCNIYLFTAFVDDYAVDESSWEYLEGISGFQAPPQRNTANND